MSYINVIDRISQCPTAYQVIRRLHQDSHALPFDGNVRSLGAGVPYIVERAGCSAVLFCVPEDFDPSRASFDIVAAHADSPAFKVKTDPVSFDDGYVRLNVEKYGGMLVRTWQDRPVSVAGRVFVKRDDESMRSMCVDMRHVCCGIIPSLAPHQDREIEYKEISIQNHMRPVMGLASNAGCDEDGYFKRLVCLALQKDGFYDEVKPDDIVSWDLFVYDAEKPSFLVNTVSWGDSPYACDIVASPRIDDQASVWCAFDAFMSRAVMPTDRKADTISVLAVFDAEEVGSACASGADSDFLRETLQNVAECLGFGDARSFTAALRRSFVVSADGGHALHPAHPNLSDPTNKCVIGGGILVKHASSHAYMTDGLSSALIADLCGKAGISYQDYQNNSDVGGGATLGSLLSTHLGVPGADIGLPQLAMHSACECAGANDIDDLESFFEAFYSEMRTDIR